MNNAKEKVVNSKDLSDGEVNAAKLESDRLITELNNNLEIYKSEIESKDLRFEELQNKHTNQSENFRQLESDLKKYKDQEILQNTNLDMENVSPPEDLKKQLLTFENEIGKTKKLYENLQIKYTNQCEKVRQLQKAGVKYKTKKVTENMQPDVENFDEELEKQLLIYEKKNRRNERIA